VGNSGYEKNGCAKGTCHPAVSSGSGPSGLLDFEFTHTGPQGAAVEVEYFRCTVFAADFPIGLFQYPDHMCALNRFQSFCAATEAFNRLF
jgi:hypothetical protein